MQDFKKLAIYQKSIQYCMEIYSFSTHLPDQEKYGMVSQIRRAVTSIPLNISEGSGASSNREFAQFIGYAYRSTNEVITCLELVERLHLYPKDSKDIHKLQDEGLQLSRMIYAFFKKLGGRTFNL